MNASEQQFRSAAIGGFNRQDVMRYIETVTRENNARISMLEKELEETKEKSKVMALELAGFRAESAEREENITHLSTELEKKSEALTQKTALLSNAERELVLLRGKVKNMEKATSAYETLKELAGTIELDARKRAQTMVLDAENTAQQTREELEQWMERVQVNYVRLRQDVDAMLTHAGSEMERTRRAVDDLVGSFAEQDDALRHIIETYREATGGVQISAPVDLETREALAR